MFKKGQKLLCIKNDLNMSGALIARKGKVVLFNRFTSKNKQYFYDIKSGIPLKTECFRSYKSVWDLRQYYGESKCK